ncbi:PAS domain-containing hybrid sensor histidine kinase/response regulator [Sphingomonas quercus]|uniref:histidine kinase n=1 Tax=Sphingomonas quercus TaxID=2842451 RepID=A0ABS6BP96_9SPHN|nr:PAS domain-containing hybrid sensor histidine kinase/response regulator [Sphingomonas quercus]MBU3079477.1 PAS domain-containing protein [Sphingomonas quercus]
MSPIAATEAVETATRLFHAQDAGAVYLFEIAADGEVRCGEGMRRLLGVAPGARLDRDIWLAAVHDEDRQRLRASFARMDAGGHEEVEYRAGPGGAAGWLLTRGGAAPGGGSVRSIFGATLDITRQGIVAENDERLRMTLDAGRMASWSWDLATNRWTWDRRRFELFGLDPNDGEPDYEQTLALVHPEDRAQLRAAIEGALAAGDGTYQSEFRVPLPDGEVRWLGGYGRAIPGPDGRPARMLGLSFDITEHRVAAAERDRAMALLQTFVEAVPGVVCAKDRDGRMLLVNQGTAAVVGKPSAALIGKVITEFLDDPQQAEAVAANDRRVLETGVAEQIEEEVGWRDGMPIVWLSTKAPLLDALGRVTGLVATSLDITDRKRDEELLARGRLELEHLVEERTRHLHETQTQLAHAQRMEALGQLAGGIAHDFNNILQAIQGASSLIERQASSPDAVRHLATMVGEAIGRGASITRRLLSFSRRGELQGEALDPAQLLASLREILSLTLGSAIEVRVEVAAGVPPLLADKGQLETVLVNLAANARDALDGAGMLTLTASPGRRGRNGRPGHPIGLTPGDYVRIAVCDNGHGMDAATLARASDPYFTTKQPGKGTGLGLAMARGFAEQSGGGLHIDSAPGRGTTVTLWLPAARMEAASAPSREDAPPPRGERPRLMVVDDNDLVREMLAENLIGAGYEVIQASRGATALALMRAGEQVDLLVSDLSMPEMNGLALIRAAQQQQPALRAILLTGYAGEIPELFSGDAEEADFCLLRKPVTGQQLARQVASLLHADGAGQDGCGG